MYLYTFTWFSFTYVRPHESNIIGRLMNRLVLPGGNVLLDRSQVHGLFDDRGVIIEACHISREECKMWSLRKVLKISAVSWQHWEGFSFDFVGGRRNEHLPPTNYPIRKHKTYPILCNRQVREMVLKDQCEWYERLAKRMLSHWRHTITDGQLCSHSPASARFQIAWRALLKGPQSVDMMVLVMYVCIEAY